MHVSVTLLSALVAVAAAQQFGPVLSHFNPRPQQFGQFGGQPEQFLQFDQKPAAAVASATPVPIIGLRSVQDDFGQSSYAYATGDGAAFTDHVQLKANPDGSYSPERSGTASYYAPDGQLITLKYSAGVEGTRFEGDHLPKAPAVPVV